MARRSTEETRQHILRTAGDLFYSRGVRAVGMDMVTSAAAVANATLYRQFPTKDDLVTACLVDRNIAWWDRVQEATSLLPDGRARILALFATVETDMEEPGYRGCATLNVAAEFPELEHPARRAALAHQLTVLSWLRAQCALGEASDPGALADQLMIVLDGAQVLASALGPAGPCRSMMPLVNGLLANGFARESAGPTTGGALHPANDPGPGGRRREGLYSSSSSSSPSPAASGSRSGRRAPAAGGEAVKL